jgi:DNA-binding beta-propeller fold protein YncE
MVCSFAFEGSSGMFWRGGNVRRLMGALMTMGACMPFGCARPQGDLFPAVHPPIVWPKPPETPRIQFVGVIESSTDLKAAQPGSEVLLTALRGPRPPLEFSSPHGVALRAPDTLAVADSAGGCVHLIDLGTRDHTMVRGFGKTSRRDVQGADDERFLAPVGVAWVGDRLFVTDAQRNEVVELDAMGRYRGRFSHAALRRPVGIAYAARRNQLYVVNGDEHNIAVFDLDGSLVRLVGSRGVEPGAFNWPSHVSIRGDRVYVSDAGNFRVQVLDLDGVPLSSIGGAGMAAGDLALPKGVAVDSEGHVYVVDARFENVQVFNDRGQLLLAFGSEGAKRGRFSLPAGIAIDEMDRIWIADAGNRRVQVFMYLRAS